MVQFLKTKQIKKLRKNVFKFKGEIKWEKKFKGEIKRSKTTLTFNLLITLIDDQESKA